MADLMLQIVHRAAVGRGLSTSLAGSSPARSIRLCSNLKITIESMIKQKQKQKQKKEKKQWKLS